MQRQMTRSQRSDLIFVFTYKDGAFESVSVSSKKSSNFKPLKIFRDKLRSVGKKKLVQVPID
jgi:hypothetical protein